MVEQLSTVRVALLEPQPLLAERVRALLTEVGATPVAFDESPDVVLAVADAPVAGWTDAVSAARASFHGTFVWSWFGPSTHEDGVHLERPFDATALSEALRQATLSGDAPSRQGRPRDPVATIAAHAEAWAALQGEARLRAVAATLRQLGLVD